MSHRNKKAVNYYQPLRIKDRLFYPYLVSQGQGTSLMEALPETELKSKLTVCLASLHPHKANKLLHFFSYFDQPADFYQFQAGLAVEDRAFFEIIWGDQAQKPFFDLDLNLTDHPDLISHTTELLTAMTTAINRVMSKLPGVTFQLERDLRIYSSHSLDQPTSKKSYHLVCVHHQVASHRHNLAFCQEVLAELPVCYHPAVDLAVYSNNRQFRCLGSQKAGSGRIKIPCSELTSPPQTDDYLALVESLVSYTVGCQPLPIRVEPAKPKIRQSVILSADNVQAALAICYQFGGYQANDPNFPYRFREVRGAIISLKRIRSSNCITCQRVHEHENPFLLVRSDGEVCFCCRRQAKLVPLGRILPSVEEEEPEAPSQLVPPVKGVSLTKPSPLTKLAQLEMLSRQPLPGSGRKKTNPGLGNKI